MDGINFITDDKGNQTGIILDLISLKKQNVSASEVLEQLSGLQQLIDNADSSVRKGTNWDHAKEQLRKLKP